MLAYYCILLDKTTAGLFAKYLLVKMKKRRENLPCLSRRRPTQQHLQGAQWSELPRTEI